MEQTVSREQLFDFFIDSCYLLQDYKKVEGVLYDEAENDEAKLEELLKGYREHQSFDHLVPILIFTARYYFENGVNSLAAIYLMECQCILEYLDVDHLLRGYILAELGYIYECKGELQQANYYYTAALSFGREKQIPLLMTYSLENLVHIMLVLCQRKSVKKFQQLMIDYHDEPISKQCKDQIELLNAYVLGDYKFVIKMCEESFDSKNKLLESSIYNHAMYQLGRSENIEWDLILDEECLEGTSAVYSLMNLLMYHLVKDDDEQLYAYLKELFSSLADKNLHHLLRFGYHFLCRDTRIRLNLEWMSEFEESLNQVYDLLHYQEQLLKQRIQSIYHSYREYYNNLDLVRTKQKYKVVTFNQLPICYQYEYTPKTVLGYFKLDHCFYSEFKDQILKQVIETINEFIGESITFSVENEGVWFYFNACYKEVKLKRKLNRLVELWYEKIGQPYYVSFGLPRYTTSSFEETAMRVKSDFFGMILKSNTRLPYEISFCQQISWSYNFSLKIRQLLDAAYQAGEFNLDYTPLYYRDGAQLFGVECHNKLDDHLILNRLSLEERTEAPLILTIEKELYLFEVGCQYINQISHNSCHRLSLFIKLSRYTLLNKFLSSRISNCLKKYGIDPSQVIISVNEDVLFEQNILIHKGIKRLREFGINIALDEYGAGALTGSIRNLNIDYLRISSCLIQYLKNSSNCVNMMKSLLNVCSSKDVKICCSEIENESSLHLISDFGIDVVSGSYYQRKLVV